jgi:DNA-directed RNA polymerase specialized sigma24 family protein
MNACLEFDTHRDGRYRSRMHKETKPVDALLEAWGKWSRQGLAHLGFPRQAVIARIHGRSTAPADMPDYLLEVEQAVLTLPAIRRRVIAEHYTYWQPIEVSARHCHMSASRFRKLLEQGRKAVIRLLDASHTLA